MKANIGLIVVGLFCLGMGVALVAVRKQATDQHQIDTQNIQDYSNQVVKVTDQLQRQEQVNAVFEKDLDTQKKAFTDLTNDYTSLSANLAQATGALSKTEETLKSTQQEVAKRDVRIAELETENQALDDQALQLRTSITNLTLQIAETERKLAASEGDKAFLETELQRLMSQKADLERQFNDLSALRAQLAKVKQELHIARRIEWHRRGLVAGTEQKGAQQLMQGVQLAQTKSSEPAYDLNVEVDANGSVNVSPPVKPPKGSTTQ